MAIMSLFSRALPRPIPAVEPPANPHHWNYGNYIGETATDSNALFNQIVARLTPEADPNGNWKGVMIRKTWAQLEAGLGDYNAGFDSIDQRLSQISSLGGRRLMIFIQVKTFGASTNAVPAYMRNSATYADGKNYYSTRDGVVQQGSRNGQYAYESSIGGPGGFVPNMHVTAVKERWQAFMEAFATRFNGNEYLEAVVINEASIAEPIGSAGPANEVDKNGVVITRPNTDGSEWVDQDTWFTNMAAAHLVARTALENIQICQWINGPRPKMSTYSNQTLVEGWVPIIAGHGIGLGMTDLAINDVGFQYVPKTTPGGTYFSDHPGNIFLIQQFGQGNGIVVGHASAECYRGSVANRNQGTPPNNDTPKYPGPQQTRQETQAFAKNTVGVTHLVWGHNTSDDPYYPGMSMNDVTDAFIHNPASDISTVTARPAGW